MVKNPGKDTLDSENVFCRNTEILLDPKFEDVTESDLRRVIQETLGILKVFGQNWLVQEEFVLVVLNTAAKTGQYIGKWEGKHHILITVSGKETLTNPRERMSLMLIICHELLHQKFAEILMLTDPNGINIETKLEHKLLQSKSSFERAENIAFSGVANASFLQKALNEGFAVYGELKILEGLMKEESLSPEQKEVIDKFLKERQRDLSEMKDHPSTYKDGHYLIMELINRLEIGNLLDVVASIDWEACRKIDLYSTQYEQVLQDPTLIPGVRK